MKRVMNMTYASSLTDLCSINSSFDRGILRVAYTGKNRNNSYISKEAFENSIKTMFNCPIVCNYDRETDTLGGHDIEVVRDSAGNFAVVNVTTPVGCIPESSKYWWDKVEEDDGTIHEYLFVEALLWKRQEAYQKIKRDGIAAQSMEITVHDSYEKDGIVYINSFEFAAFALIGVTPCFESAGLELFSTQDFKEQLSEMMRELKESYNLVNPSEEVNDIHPQNISTEGGEKVLQEKLDLAASYGINVDDLEFSLDDFDIEELKVKFEEMTESDDHATEEEDEQRFELESNLSEEIWREVASLDVVHYEWGDMPRYCYADMDAELGEVYVWDHEDWLLYGFGYNMDGDHVKIDIDSKKRMKYAIVPFDEGEQASPFAEVFTEIGNMVSASTDLEAKFQEASDTIKSMETELGELRQFKADAERKALNSAREEVFARFEDLIGVEAFENLRANSESYTDMQELEDRCFAIRGRLGINAKFSLDEKTPKLKVVRDDSSKEPYGGILSRFGIEAE